MDGEGHGAWTDATASRYVWFSQHRVKLMVNGLYNKFFSSSSLIYTYRLFCTMWQCFIYSSKQSNYYIQVQSPRGSHYIL